VTEEQTKQLMRTQAIVGPAIIDRYGMLVDFLDEAGLSDTENVVQKINLLVPDFSLWLLTRKLQEDEKADALLMIALFIGEVFCQRWSGCWLLTDKADSPHFGTYVVSKFKNLPQKNAVVNPFMIATEFLEEAEKGPYARNLEQVIADVEKTLQTA
jgi:hypothetical protein